MIDKILIGYRFITSKGSTDYDLWAVGNDEDAKEYAIELKKIYNVKSVKIYRRYEVVEEVK